MLSPAHDTAPGRRLLIPQPGEDMPVALACCSSLPFLERNLRGGRDFCGISNASSLAPRMGTRQADLMPTRAQSCSHRHDAAVKKTEEGSVLRRWLRGPEGSGPRRPAPRLPRSQARSAPHMLLPGAGTRSAQLDSHVRDSLLPLLASRAVEAPFPD